ncbi:glyoxylase-like metal-dependent hydrolase (beta-lactamase superfamily II) [Nonomuraea dietziae]|uniref:Glyoxylase-like metal-dependent hydrolase (Beta-lactamase superfamily II) n=1 Tax=Nonomuraea dietziae TaxID=65515 RepID=A0A7W5Y5P7_9ACTN|nr:glyoxylase-like metal-dependent hydrolase (beta-lactamase superfamily II) [Nonomuraea dietziae]
MTVIETSSLGDRSYVATDGDVAVVVDPQRDVDRVLVLAGRLGVRITHVVETHLHNDYVSGGLELSRLTGARYGVAAADRPAFEHVPLADGDVVEVSPGLRLRALATPGHTFHHLSYVLESHSGVEGVFTGGSLLFGTTGRTDLLGEEHADSLARRQHTSVRKLADSLPGGAVIWPTHGFGSFCSATQSSGDSSTLDHERQVNPALRLAEDEFVTQTLAGLDAYPAYYAHMGAINLAGPAPVDLRPPSLADAKELRARLEAGEWVVDLRHRTAFATAHLAGTISLGLDGSMATWLGWLVDRGAPLSLVGESLEQVSHAQRELARIGIDRVAAAAGRHARRTRDRLLPDALDDDRLFRRPGSRDARRSARSRRDPRCTAGQRVARLPRRRRGPRAAARAGPQGGGHSARNDLGPLRQRLPCRCGGVPAGKGGAGGGAHR